MSLIQCAGGAHWYDDAKYMECPYCSPNAKPRIPMQKDGEEIISNDIIVSQNTILHSDTDESPRFVAGWLVCSKGPDKGTDYKIFDGKNFVGRDASMDIVIKNDTMVSRNRHCSIVYDQKGNVTYLVPEKGNMVEVDSKPVVNPIVLKNFDSFRIGGSVLTYVAFCEGDRRWEE